MTSPSQRKPPNSPQMPRSRSTAPCTWRQHLLLLLPLGPGTGTRRLHTANPRHELCSAAPGQQTFLTPSSTPGQQKPRFLSTMPKRSRIKLLALPGEFPEKWASREEVTPLQPQRKRGDSSGCARLTVSAATRAAAGGAPISSESVDILITVTEYKVLNN